MIDKKHDDSSCVYFYKMHKRKIGDTFQNNDFEKTF